VVAMLAICCAATCPLALAPGASVAGATTTAQPESANSLAEAHARQELRKLEIENEDKTGVRGFFSNYAALLTALVAAGGLLLTFSGQVRAGRREREVARQQATSEREQRERESQRTLEERFSALLADLGSERDAIQAAAAISLLTFLSPENAGFHQQVMMATLANLKVEHPPAITKLLRTTFQTALRSGGTPGRGLDLSGASLAEADLAKLDLTEVTLDATDLREASLNDGVLVGAHGRGVILEGALLHGNETTLLNARLPKALAARARFDGATLVNAHLEGADLRGAGFRGARMQAAHLEDSQLAGAQFDGADVADTYFLRASFDDAALRSLARTNWTRAHISPADMTRLGELASTA